MSKRFSLIWSLQGKEFNEKVFPFATGLLTYQSVSAVLWAGRCWLVDKVNIALLYSFSHPWGEITFGECIN